MKQVGFWAILRAIAVIAVFAQAAPASVEVTSRSLPTARTDIAIGLDRAVKHRVFLLSNPARLVIDLDGVDPKTLSGDLPVMENLAGQVANMRAGWFAEGWTRIVFDLSEPVELSSVSMTTGRNPQLDIALKPVSEEDFAATLRDLPQWHLSKTAPPVREKPQGKLRIVLDPGHGGVDPGAIRDGVAEKDIALIFAHELRTALLKSEQFDVLMTRDADFYVGLKERVDIARSGQGDVFISLHANTVTRGNATGAAIYTLSDEATDEEAQALAELENRSDLVAGVDLQGQDSDLALTLLELAQRETNARSKVFAASMVEGLRGSVGVIRTKPHRAAGFRVLKAPDIPSLLLELGFLSDPNDRARMLSPVWRELAIEGIITAVEDWAERDTAMSQLSRR